MAGPWSTKFVGSHMFLPEPRPQDGTSWDVIPSSWNDIRFDAVDVLFISPFFVNPGNYSIVLGPEKNGGTLEERFKWVIRAARSANPSIKIILEQFYDSSGRTDFSALGSDFNKISQYANSVATFIESYYQLTLPSINGVDQVSARIDGLDVDVESGNLISSLPEILTAIRSSLDGLSRKLGGAVFTLSISPAWPSCLDDSVAKSCSYINMQNYSGGQETRPCEYIHATGVSEQYQLVWGFAPETPWTNTTTTFEEVKAKVSEVVQGKFAGTWTWRLNSNNYVYENMFQVWLFNTVHGTTLPDSEPEKCVAKYWQFGGRSSEDPNSLIPIDCST